MTRLGQRPPLGLHLPVHYRIPASSDLYVSTRLVSIEFKVIYDSQMINHGEKSISGVDWSIHKKV